MTNPRDTGRWDAIAQEYVDQQVQIDFAWGNIPMQPNDDRGMAQLDPELDSHIIATSGYEGFPAFITGGIYDDTVPNVVVPNIIGAAAFSAETALAQAGLSASQGADVTAGATSGNNDTVATQSPAAGEFVNAGTVVNYSLYNYVAPGNPIAGMSTTNIPSGWSAMAGGEIVMYLLGRTTKPTVGHVVSISGNTNSTLNQNYNVNIVENDDHYNTGGTAVKLTAITNALGNPDTNSGGVWVQIN